MGKSNILRALSVFFTNQPEPGVDLDIGAECSARHKEKKRISISVEFSLPESIKIHKNLKAVEEKISRKARITKEFTLSQASPQGYEVEYSIGGTRVSANERVIVDQFLSLFNFRYVTAERTPSAVLQNNLEELKSELQARINRSPRSVGFESSDDAIRASTLDQLKDVADDFFAPIKEQLKRADTGIRDVQMATPDSVMELLNSARYEITTHAGDIHRETVMGSGVQNLLLFAILFLVDRNYHRKFGWKIATIWGVEEPEVFLHFDLENQLANYFAEVAQDDQNRFQILCTSHSNTFPQYADSHYLVRRDSPNSPTTTVNQLSIHDFINALHQEQVSALAPALTLYPTTSIWLVEGEIDEKVLSHILTKRSAERVKVFSIKKFTSDNQFKGEANLYDYARINVRLLNARPKTAPVVVIFDWDVDKSKLGRLRKRLTGVSSVISIDEDYFNDNLGKSFRGIERSYPTKVVEAVKKRKPGFILDRGQHVHKERFQVDAERYDHLKQELMNEFLASDDEGELGRFVDDLLSSLK